MGLLYKKKKLFSKKNKGNTSLKQPFLECKMLAWSQKNLNLNQKN